MDIKASNFVIPFDHNLNYSLTSCKLIDFNFSIITNNEQEEVDELFGTNIYVPPEFLTTKIACMEENKNRPSINAIYDFLNEKCHGFKYERNIYPEITEWCID
uniref:Protein kinase domain-containing protein n=1 Tax=Meloidogyne hapla TaxID=6305 RepID=A0A1I8AXA2_MELHA